MPNRPAFSRATETDAGTFEIWFFVVFVPALDRAFWFRYELTRLRGEANAHGMVWAASFQRGEETRYGKRIIPRSACSLGTNGAAFDITFGDAGRVADGALEGSVGDIAWALRFDRSPAPSQRTPAFLERLPLPTHGAHPHTEVPFAGSVTIDGTSVELRPDDALGTQVHLWGTGRPDGIRWIYANAFDGKSALEVSNVRPKQRAPDITFATLATRHVHVNVASGLARVRSSDSAIVARVKSARNVLVARGHAQPESFASYIYRDPSGHDLYVSQSDLAHVEIETFERAGFGRMRPTYRSTAAHAAIELHQRTPIAGRRYVEWLEESPPQTPQCPVPTAPIPRAARQDGDIVDLPVSPGRIFAAGLTYAGHVEETGSAASKSVVLFEKSTASWLLPSSSVDRVASPDAKVIANALDDLEPGLGRTLLDRWNGLIPPLLDYEVELGLLLLQDVDGAILDDPNARIRAGWFLANDLTARTCQVLGEGAATAAESLAFWSLAKSFPGFCPVTRTMFVPHDPVSLDAPPPSVTLTTRVRGELRQKHRPRASRSRFDSMLQAAFRQRRELRANDALLTGTPAGIAFKVSPLKRAIGARIFDRFARVEAAFGMYTKRPDVFLGVGDEVTVDGEFLGSRTIVIGDGHSR